jgi:cytochrome c oxidase subunit 3
MLGAAFLTGQTTAWRVLVRENLTTSIKPGVSFFYILTGAHAVHVLCGLLALLYALAATSVFSKTLEARRIIVDITAWYWHAMAGLWLYILAVLALGNRATP